MNRMRGLGILVVAGALAACSTTPATTTSPTPTAPAAATVDVTLREFAVLPSSSSALASENPITFNATNEGPDDDHEFVVFQLIDGGDVNALPTNDDGSVDEEGEGIALVDEVEELAPGDSESITLTLDAGAYALVCNLVETEGETVEVHYQLGMRASFTVA